MSSPALPEWLAIFTSMITDGTPVGNNGLVQSLLCKQCKPKHPVAHGGGTVSATGKMKVGRNANFVLIRTKFVLLVEYEKHRLRPANV